MRSLVVLILAGVLITSSVVHAEIRPEDTAKAVADEFMKAFIAGDEDAAVKAIDVPFVALMPLPGGPRFDMLGNLDEAHDYVRGMMSMYREGTREGARREPKFVVGRAVPLADIQRNLPENEYFVDLSKKMVEAAGADGFVVVMNEIDGKQGPQDGVLTRFHDGSAKVVGIVFVFGDK